MALLIRVFVVVIVLGIAVVVQKHRQLSKSQLIPDLPTNQYWGSDPNYKENTAVLPFDIGVPANTGSTRYIDAQSVSALSNFIILSGNENVQGLLNLKSQNSEYFKILEDLNTQLNRPLRFAPGLEGIGFEYGFNSNYLKKVVDYWRTTYLPKWSEREQYLKKFDHYQTQIQGLKIHFIHVKPKKTQGKQIVPLLLLHGWPGSVREFYDLITLLNTKEHSKYAFEIVAPSLPGYGWSEGSAKPNLGPAQVAVIFRNLMLRLKLTKFIVQGGDWGALIGSNIATLYPQNVLGFHSNMCASNHPLSQIKTLFIRFFPQFFVDEDKKEFFKPMGTFFGYLIRESGYFHLQATKPDTIGNALTGNPIGIAAYILEKFSTWTNGNNIALKDGGLTQRYSLDSLLDNIMIYYTTNSITTSVRLYSEAFSKAQFGLGMDLVHVTVPTACARFLHDIAHNTDCELKHKFVNLIQSTFYKDGGHFAAMELPQTMYDDLTSFVHKVFEGTN